MRLALALLLAACGTTETPVREGHVQLALSGSEDHGTAIYRVRAGTAEERGFCGHVTHNYVPLRDAQVLLGPAAGEQTELLETSTAGLYEVTLAAAYAEQYRFTVDGETFEIAAPPRFNASVRRVAPRSR